MKKDSPFWNEKMETLSPDEYRAVHTKMLVEQLDYVDRNSIFYQAKFRESGIEVGKIRSLEDLTRLPFTQKAELRDSQIASPPLGNHRACPPPMVQRIYSTCGTTG
ncbi:MAG: phenylacetate--CoA ligase family protein, partial [Syntrophales bacterium LBB04]|nr:phenylacetate--CoA ligase family protein [Syntrophales bacterium LBB04]